MDKVKVHTRSLVTVRSISHRPTGRIARCYTTATSECTHLNCQDDLAWSTTLFSALVHAHKTKGCFFIFLF